VQCCIAHSRNTLGVVARSVLGIGISRLAGRLVAVLSEITVHRDVLLLLRGRLNQTLAALFCPSVDEVAVRAVRVAAGKLEGGGAGPAVRESATEVIADGEAQLRHGFHAGGTGAVAAGGAGLVCCFEGLGVDACGGN